VDHKDWIDVFKLASLWEKQHLIDKLLRSIHYLMAWQADMEAEYVSLSIQVKRPNMFTEGIHRLVRREHVLRAADMRTLGLNLAEKILELRERYHDDRLSLLRLHKTFFEVDLHTFGTWAEIDKEDYTTMRNILLGISKDLRKQEEREKSRDQELRMKIDKLSAAMHTFAQSDSQITLVRERDQAPTPYKTKSNAPRRSKRARTSTS
jgi:hypothetical protein